MNVVDKGMRFGGDDEGEDFTTPVTIAKLVLTNKVLENLLDNLTERLVMIKKVARMGLETDDGDTVGYRFMLRAIEKITSKPHDLTFLEGFTEFDNDDDE